jgi:prepilin-type N-terminal cleavage/methylation domain-containing protein
VPNAWSLVPDCLKLITTKTGLGENMSQKNKKSNAVQNQAFTLVELLTVITIIVLLIGIVAPSVRKGLLLAKRASAAAYLSSVSNAALQYKTDNAVFPGQDHTDRLGDTNTLLTGSQMLAICLLDGLHDDDNDTPVPTDDDIDNVKSNYLDYKAGETTKTLPTVGGGTRDYTLTDMWKSADDPRAMLYYPSRIGNDGTIGTAFVYADNSDYLITGTDMENGGGYGRSILDTRFGTGNAYNADTFILIGPSIDRIYFSNVDNNGNSDNIMNIKE